MGRVGLNRWLVYIVLGTAIALGGCSKRSVQLVNSNGVGNANSNSTPNPTDPITFSRSAASFGSLNTGNASVIEFSMSNSSSRDVQLTRTPYLADSTGIFTINLGFSTALRSSTGICGLILSAGTTCTFSVRFSPASAQTYSDGVYFSYTYSGQVFNRLIPVSGIGNTIVVVEEPNLVLAPSGASAIEFGTTLTEQPKNVTVTLRNPSSSVPITLVDSEIGSRSYFNFIPSTAKIPSNSAVPAQTLQGANNCVTMLAPGASCTAMVSFFSTGPSVQSGFLRVSYRTGSSSVLKTAEVTLTGTIRAPLVEAVSRLRKGNQYAFLNETAKAAYVLNGWEDQGRVFDVFSEPAVDSVPIFIFDNAGVFSIELSGPVGLLLGYVYRSDSTRSGPRLFRLLQPSLQQNVYTSSATLRDKLVNAGWVLAGILGVGAGVGFPGDDITLPPRQIVNDPPIDVVPPSLVSMARFFHPSYKQHIHVANITHEAGRPLNPSNQGGWNQDTDTAFTVYNGPAAGTVEIHHMYVPGLEKFYLTSSSGEKDFLIANTNWRKLRTEGYIFSSRPAGIATTEIFHLYNPDIGDRVYTIDAGRRDQLVVRGWLLQTSLGWTPYLGPNEYNWDPISLHAAPPQLAMYRVGFKNPPPNGPVSWHFFTALAHEYAAVQAPDNGSNGGGGVGEGEHFRVWANQEPDTVPVYRINIPGTRKYELILDPVELQRKKNQGWVVFSNPTTGAPIPHGYIYPNGSRGGHPVKAYSHPTTGSSIYTPNDALGAYLTQLPENSWQPRGILGYAPVAGEIGFPARHPK